MPAQKKYPTPGGFRSAINKYFMRISSQEPIYRRVLVGRTNKGKPRYDYRETYTEDGELITHTVYHLPPSQHDLLLHLGITKPTWASYADASRHPKHAEIAAWAMLKIEAYYAGEAATRDRVDGVKFILTNGFRWGERQIVETENSAAPIRVALEGELDEWSR